MLRFLLGRFYGPCLDADGGGAGGGAGAGTGTGGAGSEDGSGTGEGGGQGASAGSGGNGQPFATFPDEASFMRRVAQMSKQELEKTAKELGFESADAMKAAAKAQKEANEKNKTELEKEKAAREKAEREGKAALEAANTRLINAEIKIAAQAAGFVDPADAVALVDRANIQIDDQGKVTGAKEAIEALKKAKPHLVSKSGGSVGGGSNPPGAGGGAGGKNMNDYIRKMAGRR